MAGTDPVESPLEAAAGAAGLDASEAFSLLGNETRLAILLALWERYDPHDDDNAVAFSDLFERVDYDTAGNFSYHLQQLEGRFVRQRSEREGYELRGPGLKLVQSVIAGIGVDDPTREPTEVDQPCPLCGAATAISYREGVVLQTCTECEGPTPEETETEGVLSAVTFDPAGLADRTPEELRAASRAASLRQVQSMFDGICPTCSGRVDGTLECCPEHDSTGICEHCGTTFVAWARFRCRICKDHATTSPKALVLLHPAAIGFYDERGVSTRVHADDFESARRVFDLMDDHGLELVSEDPPRVDVTVEYGDDERTLTFDETVSVVDVRR